MQLLLRNKAYPWSTAVTDLGEVSKDNKKVKKILTLIRRVIFYVNVVRYNKYVG